MLFKIVSSQERIKKKTLKLNWWWTKLEQQVRELEQQLNKSTQQRQSSVLSGEEEFLGMGVLQKTPPQERNVNYIRTIEKEKRVALEVCIATTTEACRPTISCLAKVCVCVCVFFYQCQPLIKWKFEFQRYIKSSYFKLTMRNGSMHSYQAG